MKILILLSLYFILTSCELSVEEYKNVINEFIARTENYSSPTSARDFLNGSYDLSGCEAGDEYDFIIVGGGSAGCVLASRLSEVKEWKVLLLEAGGEENSFSDIPAMLRYLQLSEMNWGYKSVPQKNTNLGYVDRIHNIARGKVLGGTSVLNLMMYVRGNKDDYNKWGMSNPGWSNDDVMPYFTKSENTIVSPQDYLFHGHDGKLHTENINELSQMAQLLLSAAEERGYNIVDYNGKNQIGFGPIQSTTHNGQRHSTAKAFIDKERTNLKVSTESFVVQILIENNVAYGVKYIKEGRTRCDRATKEVILSAGVFNSPQLLMLAGIGPREHLNSLGIKVIQDLPVGKNMWDHTVSSASIFTINLTLPQYDQDENIKQYKEGHGLFTVPVNVQVVGFENVTSHDANVPDVEHVIAVTKPPYVSWEKVNKYNNIGLDVYNNINKKMAEQTIWQSYTFLLHPKSRGTVTLKSNDPMDYPQIDPNIFSDPEGSDINTLAASMKQLMQMSNTKALQQVNSQPMEIDLPNCKNFSHGTDEHIKCILRHTAFSLGHYSGTCKMGPISDKSSVVGNDLKVHGIESLRVADCSVIPVTTSGHTNAVAIMIGEKAADLMKKKWIG